MTYRELAKEIDTPENRAGYAATADKSIFAQSLIEAAGVITFPCSPLCDFIEDRLSA